MESAPVPPTALPASTVNAEDLHKDKTSLEPEAEVHPAGALEYVNDDEEPTDEEFNTLRKVPAKMKWVSIALCTIELAERASYLGCSGVVKNFVNRPLPKGGNGAGAVAPGAAGENQTAGALGKGTVTASAVYNAFIFLAYVLPIVGGIVADTKWGRFKTIAVGTGVGIIAHVLLVISAIPSVIGGGHAIGPFLLSLYILSFASGFIKPCLATLMCDQIPVKRPTLKTLPSGERVIVDPQTTVQRYLLIFYFCINVGGFFAIASSYSARFVGYWLAYLLPGIVYMIMPLVLAFLYKKLYHAPPQGSVTLEAFRVLGTCLKNGGWKTIFNADKFWNRAKPSQILAEQGSIDHSKITWDDLFVDEMRQSLAACVVFLLTPIFIMADGGIGAQENALSSAVTLDNAPNDVIDNLNPLTIIFFTPIITYGFYPFFEKIGYPLKPMTRLSIGFMLGCINMIYGAVLQWKVYKTSPCGYYASTADVCEDVSSISIWALTPLQALPAIGEIFVMVTGYELAYTRAPARMKGLVYAICLFSSAISSAIGLACSNAIQDPYLIWPYVALAVACFICAVIFPVFFRHLNEPTRVFADPARQAGKLQPIEGEEVKHSANTSSEKI
ncbi:POT family proton-dependent oligopeptide transporter [Kwoniella mangroviensis CBS 10435]|uniref:POT family proton-dependent oligopeptide transporter n=1 Tax=Kwoniella mangroviensis CBS 10435 TaxID=1331196 RepID=A0A1B9J3F7_9TREE|nr:POT family proton-dependent oligopeptide transporter [Kwoniella mangroviensis CBS 10435]